MKWQSHFMGIRVSLYGVLPPGLTFEPLLPIKKAM